MKNIKKLVKIALQTKGYFWTNYGPITDLVKLHKYVSDEENFVFFVELAYECEIGVAALVEWAEEVRLEEIEKMKELKSKNENCSTNEPF